MSITLETTLAGLRRHRWLFAGILACSTGVAVVVALLSQPVYRSQVVIAPVADNGAMGVLGGLASQFGGLASLAGVSLGKGGNWSESVATLRSRHLIESLVTKRNLLPVLFDDTQDAATMGDAVLLFQNTILAVQEDAKTGLVTVSVKWHDREAAAEWANALVLLADQELRSKAIETANSSLAALQRELNQTQEVELRSAISRLMEAQLKVKLAAAVQQSYAYKVIDPAVAADPDKRAQPTRTTMVLAGVLFGLLAGLLAVALRMEFAGRRV